MKTTPDFNKAEQHLFNFLKEKGFKMRVGQIKDFGLFGDESEDEIEGYAEDWMGEVDQDTDVEFTEQDNYLLHWSYAVKQGEMIERFRNEY